MDKIRRVMELLNVNTDSELANVLGVTRQAIHAARKTGDLSKNLIKKAASELNLTETELRSRMEGNNSKTAHEILLCQLSEHISRLAIENGKLQAKIEKLLRENFALHNSLEKHAPGAAQKIPASDQETLFERLDTEDVARLFEDLEKVVMARMKEATLEMLANRGKSKSLPADEAKDISNSLNLETLTALAMYSNCIKNQMVKAMVFPSKH